MRNSHERQVTPTVLFHASPWKLKVGTNLKPRWSSFTGTHKIWMSSSLVASVGIAEQMIQDHVESIPGYCGTGYQVKLKGQMIGAWIYRVKPSGKIEKNGKYSEYTTAFPVRIVGIETVVGEPEKNTVGPLKPMSDVEAAYDAMEWDCKPIQDNIDKIVHVWNTTPEEEKKDPKSFKDPTITLEVLFKRGPVKEDKSFFGRIFCRGKLNISIEVIEDLWNVLRANRHLDPKKVIQAFVNRKLEETVSQLRRDRNREHTKLRPDPRYKRHEKHKGRWK